MTNPHADRPIVSSATTGPSTATAPVNAAFRTANCSTTIHTQERLVNSRHPSRRSAIIDVRGAAARSGRRSREKNAAAAANAAASTASPQPGPTEAIRMPPAEAPRIVPPLSPRRSSALAERSWSGGTVSGTSAADAGRLTPATAPLRMLNTINAGTVADPVTTRAATPPCVSAAATDVPTSRRLRGRRSARTPPKRRTATFAIERAATTSPRSAAEPVRSSTAKARAIGATALPTMLVVRAASSHRKAAWRNGPRPLTGAPVGRAPPSSRPAASRGSAAAGRRRAGGQRPRRRGAPPVATPRDRPTARRRS